MRFDVNLSMLFAELPMLERPRAAAGLGFDAVESWWPFDTSRPSPADVDRLVDVLGESGQTLVCLNFDGGDFAAGERGITSLPEHASRFRDNVDVAVSLAGRTGCRVLNALYGNARAGLDRRRQMAVAVENLTYAGTRAETVGARIVLEALNPTEFPRYGLHRLEDCLRVADRVAAAGGAAPGLLFDVYNVQRSQGDLIWRVRANADRIVHIQIADVPERLHPGTGEIAFERLLSAIDGTGYSGYVGLEYQPSATPEETFAWLSANARATPRTVGGLAMAAASAPADRSGDTA